MQTNTPKTPQQATAPAQKPMRRPNETGSITVTGFVRIFDPQSQQTFVEKQG